MCFFISKRSSSVRSKIIIMMRLNLSINSLIQTNKNKLTTTFIITNKNSIFLNIFIFENILKSSVQYLVMTTLRSPQAVAIRNILLFFYLFISQTQRQKIPLQNNKKNNNCVLNICFFETSQNDHVNTLHGKNTSYFKQIQIRLELTHLSKQQRFNYAN